MSNIIYLACKGQITKGKTDGLRDKLGILYMAGYLSDEQLLELTGMLPAEDAAAEV